MNADNQRRAREHACACYPQECCGLLVVVKGKERYLPCDNHAFDPAHNFQISPDDYARAEDLGDVVGVVHSHVNSAAIMGDADKTVAYATGLPWYVVSVALQSDVPHAGEVVRFEPAEFVAPLVGRQFSHGVLDCYTLICDYYQREFEIELPYFHRDDNWWHDG